MRNSTVCRVEMRVYNSNCYFEIRVPREVTELAF